MKRSGLIKLSNEDTIKLIAEYQSTKDIAVRNKIILGNINLIFFIAHRYRKSTTHTFDDFISEGVIGMMSAIDGFDTITYTNFGTYAYWIILKSITSIMTAGTLRIPQYRIAIYNAYEKERLRMIGNGENPSTEIIAKNLNVSNSIIIDTISKKDDISLDYVVDGKSNFGDGVSNSKNFEDGLIDLLDFEKIKLLMSSILSGTEQSVLNYRFGLDGTDPLTLKQISKHLNISAEYVRVLQNKSMLKLKKSLTKRAMR